MTRTGPAPAVQRLFEELIELPWPARRARLAHARGEDPALAQEVQGLLEASESAPEFLERPAEESELLGHTAGPWLIEARLSAGGAGDVYRARRETREARLQASFGGHAPGGGVARVDERHHLRDGAEAGEGRAHRDAGDDLFRDRRIAHPPLAELGEQPLRDLVRALVGAHLLAEDEHARVADHLFLQGLVERLAHGQDGHGYFPTFCVPAGAPIRLPAESMGACPPGVVGAGRRRSTSGFAPFASGPAGAASAAGDAGGASAAGSGGGAAAAISACFFCHAA